MAAGNPGSGSSNDVSQQVGQLAGATKTKPHQLSASTAGIYPVTVRRPEVQGQGVGSWIFPEASLLALQTATFSLGPHVALLLCACTLVSICVFSFPALVRTPVRLDEGPASWPQFTLITSFKAPPLPRAGTLAEGGEPYVNVVFMAVRTQHPPWPGKSQTQTVRLLLRFGRSNRRRLRGILSPDPTPWGGEGFSLDRFTSL